MNSVFLPIVVWSLEFVLGILHGIFCLWNFVLENATGIQISPLTTPVSLLTLVILTREVIQ